MKRGLLLVCAVMHMAQALVPVAFTRRILSPPSSLTNRVFMQEQVPQRKKGDPLTEEQRQAIIREGPSTSSSWNNVEQKKEPWIYVAASMAAVGVSLGGVFEEQVGDLFGPVRAAGGWGPFLGVKVPGQDRADELKAIEKAKKEAAKMSAIFPSSHDAIA